MIGSRVLCILCFSLRYAKAEVQMTGIWLGDFQAPHSSPLQCATMPKQTAFTPHVARSEHSVCCAREVVESSPVNRSTMTVSAVPLEPIQITVANSHEPSIALGLYTYRLSPQACPELARWAADRPLSTPEVCQGMVQTWKP